MSDIKGQTTSDLVNRDVVIKTICECECYSGDNPCKEGKSCYAVRMIRAIPPIDAVEVVRCKNCKHGKYEFIDNKDWIYCKHHYDYWTADDYCSYGEKEIDHE